MLRRRPLPSLLLLGAAALTANVDNGVGVVLAQAPQKKSKPPLQPLGDVLMLVLDKDKDGKVTMAEVNGQLATLGALFANSEGEEGKAYRAMLDGVKSWAPTIFDLLDSDQDKGLTKAELKYMTKLDKSFKKGGGMRELVRDVFAAIDANGDDDLTADEILEGIKSDETIAEITAKVHALFPLRPNPAELEGFVRDTIRSMGGNELNREGVIEYTEWMGLDEDKDGLISRKEVGKIYNVYGKLFQDISQTIKAMGPMMALFGDMGGAGGMGGMGGGAGGRGGSGGSPKTDL